MLKTKAKWLRVTKGYVASTYAQPECLNCKGAGYVGDEVSGFTPCSCATLAFRRQYAELETAGKLRERKQRIHGQDLTWLEYREIGSAI